MRKIHFPPHRGIKNRRGFTLIELLITMAILSLVISIVFQFFTFSSRMFARTDNISTQQNQARLIVQGLRKDIGTALTIALVSTNAPEDYLDGVTDPEYTAVFVKGGSLVRLSTDGTTTPIYSSYPVHNLAVEFSATSSAAIKTIHIAVSIPDAPLLIGTDIATLNTTVDITQAVASPDVADLYTGNLIVFIPAKS